ncbi:Aste57867_13076 [Aphanomyces stellatus]|uniref:Aste57867_13076 protein n=1 Tax=Aphanomyces stellatus TaxID=120398 RepID=A0A485KYV3_9STRA|nr:hypothetical protein As57867_013028 [Aphanomyces stellatus]VFT89920.1 Aste57867_13076 [Aphanomyces stellatus]
MMTAGFYDELRKLERLHHKNQLVTVWYVKNQIRLLEERTMQLKPTPAESRDAAKFLIQYAPLIVRLMLARRQVQMGMLTWIVMLNRVFGTQTLREFSTALVAGVLQSTHTIRRQFIMQTLIHATRFDCQIILADMDKRDMQSRSVRIEMHRYVTTILQDWLPQDIQYIHSHPTRK